MRFRFQAATECVSRRGAIAIGGPAGFACREVIDGLTEPTILEIPAGRYELHAWHPRHWRNEYMEDVVVPSEGLRGIPISLGRGGPIAAMPAAWQPYLQLSRLDRPIGWELLYFPCLWGMGLAWPGPVGWTYVWYAVLFMIGAIAMRGAGCTFNDIVDRDYDGRVERTIHVQA